MAPRSAAAAPVLVMGLLAALPLLAEARLSGPSEPGHNLMTDGTGAKYMANPDIDAWHSREKKRIEDECDDMMKKLDAEKRQKLQDIVDAARRQVELQRQRLLDAQNQAQGELQDLEEAKRDLKVRKPRLGPSRDLIGDQERKIA